MRKLVIQFHEGNNNMRVRSFDFSLGADPELFVWDKERERYVGGYKFTKGTKTTPTKLVYPAGSWVQADGMAIEFNTKPLLNFSNLSHQIKECIKEINQKVLCSNRFELKNVPTAVFDDEEWACTPEENKNLGCDPDWCAWTGKRNPTPNKRVKFRTGAGHLHIGWGEKMDTTPDFMRVCQELVKHLDATIGVASILFDKDQQRRTLYGKAGAFRPKPYGVEYRTLSNFWVGNTDITYYLISLIETLLFKLVFQEGPFQSRDDGVREIINTGDKIEARKFLRNKGTDLPQQRGC